MGSSSSSSKRNDRTPLPRLKKSGNGSGGSGSSNNEPESVCPISFRVPLEESKILSAGMALNIDDKGNVLMFGNVVGTLSKHQLKIVLSCKDQGVRYAGLVVGTKKNNEQIYYGEFRQQ